MPLSQCQKSLELSSGHVLFLLMHPWLYSIKRNVLTGIVIVFHSPVPHSEKEKGNLSV